MKKHSIEKCHTEIIAAMAHLQESGFDMGSLLRKTLEAMMRAERDVHNEEEFDLGIGYSLPRAFAHGKTLELQVF